MSISGVHAKQYLSPSELGTDSTTAGSEDDQSLLPSTNHAQILGGDPAASIAAMFVQLGLTQKKGDNDARQAAEAAEDNQESKQVDLMREKASETMMTGIVSGSFSFASAVASLGQARVTASSVSATGQAAGFKSDGTAANGAQIAAAKTAEKLADAQSAFAGVGGKAFDASSKLSSEIGSSIQTTTDANATAADHAGAHAKRAVDDATTDATDAQKLLDQVLSFYHDYETASAQATQATLHRA